MFNFFKKGTDKWLDELTLEEQKLKLRQDNLENDKIILDRRKRAIDQEIVLYDQEKRLDTEFSLVDKKNELAILEEKVQAKYREMEGLNDRDRDKIERINAAWGIINNNKDDIILKYNDYIKLLIEKLGQQSNHCNASTIVNGKYFTEQQKRMANKLGVDLCEE
ncbi:MAG: hypothetical protein WD512_05505 [Candidatus Paceibacterota bacterium]